LRIFPSAGKFIKLLVGADDYLDGKLRWCLWINEEDKKEALSVPFIQKRIELVRTCRLKSKKIATQKASITPYKFFEVKHSNGSSIIIPRVTSERRKYLQVGFLDDSYVVLDSAQFIYDCDPYVFSIVSSQIHTV